MASYSFSHSIDSSSTDAFSTRLNTPASLGSANIDRGDSGFDIRHSFTTGMTYDLPSKMLRGWSTDAFVLARPAAPVDLDGAVYAGPGISLMPRPDILPGQPLELFGSGYPGGKIYNRAAYLAAPPGEQGDLGRNVLRGFAATQADLGVQRVFQLRERMGLCFRGGFFNILNHPTLRTPPTSGPARCSAARRKRWPTA